MRSIGRLLGRLPWPWIARLSMLVTIGLLVWGLPQLVDGDWDRFRTSAGHHAWLLGWTFVVSHLARSRTLFNVVGAWLGGWFTAIWLSITLGGQTGEWLGVQDVWQLTVAVPVIEELVKLAPLAVVLLVFRRQRDAGTPGAVDLAVLGVAAGSGFGMHEDALWARVSSSGFDTPLSWAFPTMHTEVGTVAGHAVWTGLVGLALGFWATHRDRRITALVPLAALALVTFDHGSWNDLGTREEWRGVLLDGWLAPALLAAGLLLALVVETRRVQRRTDGTAARFARDIPAIAARGAGPVRKVQRWHRAHVILRLMALRAHSLPSLERAATRSARPTAEVTS
ncbi:MAG: PrsW family glutamic-type intramembrane protease [Actinomycetota bacterium]